MSALPENEFDLEKLFLPAWAQEPPSAKRYEKYEGGEDRGRRGSESFGARRPRRDGGQGTRRPGDRVNEGRGREPRRQTDRHGKFDGRGTDFRSSEPREHYEPPPPLPEINVTFAADENGVESIARQIKVTGRAYPLFDIARMILQKAERHTMTFSVKKKPDGPPVQPLFVCALDDTLWLSEDDAVAHVLKNHFTTFYQAERTAIEPPKGKYTFVAQCGMSGVILGPPNYHDYQNQLRKLHAGRFSRMPFETFKARVKIVRDEEVVKKWVDEQSWKTEYVCLNMPEPLRLGNMEEVGKHFREVHKDAIIKQVESHSLGGMAARGLRNRDLARLVREAWEDQTRFPLQIATSLSQQFASYGLQFFKVHKTVTHVCVARPSYLDLETTPVSEGVKRIVEYIQANPKTTRRKIIEAFAPSTAPVASEGSTGEPQTTPPATESAEPTPEQTAVIADLHWLIHQGHVIEFANGILETAKKPVIRPPKPESKAPEPAAPEPAAPEAAATEAVAPEAAMAETAESEAPVQENVASESTAESAPGSAETSEQIAEVAPAEPDAETPAASVESPS